MLRVRYMGNFPRLPRLTRLLLLIIVVLCCFGMLIHLVEPETFGTVFDGIWWTIVTIATVGYGDFAPSTVAGKMIGIILILSGAGLVSSYFATIAAVAVSSEHLYMEGKKDFTRESHIIIVGWNERSKEIIREMKILEPIIPIVLIDDSLQKHPLPRENVHFIHGKATHDGVLSKANIKKAEKVLITADLRQDEFQADMFTILTLLAVKGAKADIFCLAEILTREQIANAFRAGADGIIETNRFASEVMVKSLLDKIVPEFNEEDAEEQDSKIRFRPIPILQEWQGLTFKELIPFLLDQNRLAVGIEREGQNVIQPPPDYRVHHGDSVLIIHTQD
ncbi:potassium channel protein [Peribacillus cavernae]|uniref:Potassium channel protein n=1 Tax=Peribacillus cavernae TaxID=1674310 RepID=A0A433HCR5_9BACI|nr:potassium channel family protein [Peribacillus cavernae]MDQ0219607.1 voltage-gated potassium channel [Peribacillus cavernae]RUQ25895.1 potassium channel protein [Peribacillus cavernae]